MNVWLVSLLLCFCAYVVIVDSASSSASASSTDYGGGADRAKEARETGESEECSVWLARSTLPGTGIGMFAGRNFTRDEKILPVGDHTIPIVDMSLHQTGLSFFLWDSYTWVRQYTILIHSLSFCYLNDSSSKSSVNFYNSS